MSPCVSREAADKNSNVSGHPGNTNTRMNEYSRCKKAPMSSEGDGGGSRSHLPVLLGLKGLVEIHLPLLGDAGICPVNI